MAHAILTMGLPGSGKSTVVRDRYGDDHSYTLIDPDVVKAGHPDYDPKNPSALHAWSKAVTAAQLDDAIAAQRDVILDGTGTDPEKMVARIARMRDAGYEVTVLYVRVSLTTALARNAARVRTVPESVVRTKADMIQVSSEVVSSFADEFVIVDND